MNSEIRDAVGFPGYKVSSEGAVLSFREGNWKPLKPWVGTGGYLYLYLWVEGVRTICKVHTLICTTFHGPCPEGMLCRHLDGKPRNAAASNLKWGTPEENQADRALHGTDNSGERNGQSKLTNSAVVLIREEYATGNFTQAELAAKHGVHQSAVSRAIHRKTWRAAETPTVDSRKTVLQALSEGGA